MWGHKYEAAIGVFVKWPWEENEEFPIERCIHCGKIK